MKIKIYIMYLQSMMDTCKDTIKTDTFCTVYLLYLLLQLDLFLLFLLVTVGCGAVVRQFIEIKKRLGKSLKFAIV